MSSGFIQIWKKEQIKSFERQDGILSKTFPYFGNNIICSILLCIKHHEIAKHWDISWATVVTRVNLPYQCPMQNWTTPILSLFVSFCPQNLPQQFRIFKLPKLPKICRLHPNAATARDVFTVPHVFQTQSVESADCPNYLIEDRKYWHCRSLNPFPHGNNNEMHTAARLFSHRMVCSLGNEVP